MTEPTLLVLAAGMGSRYGSLKQIDPIGPNGEIIIDYSVYDALRAGFTHLVFVIRRDIERTFKEAIGHRFEQRLRVSYVYQELDCLPPGFTPPATRTKPWGTGHAILMAHGAINGPFAVINADDFYGRNGFQMLADHLRSKSPDYAMVGFTLRNTLSEFGTVSRGVCRVNHDQLLENVAELTRIEKRGAAASHADPEGQSHPLTGDEIVSMNMWGFQPSVFSHLQHQFAAFLAEQGQNDKAEFYIPSVVNRLIVAGREQVRVYRTDSSWFGVTYREDRPAVAAGIRRLIDRGDYPERLWS